MNREAFEASQNDADAFGGSLVAAHYWHTLRQTGFAVAVDRMAAVAHWEIMLPAMQTPPEDCERFLAKFDTAKAREARRKACGGLLAVRDGREKHVVTTARQLAAALEQCTVPPRLLDTAKGTLTSYLCEAVAADDWKSIERLAHLLKRGDTPEDSRGGELSYEGQAWREFCRLHFRRVPALPSKSEIREAMDIPENSRGDFSKWIARLGLGGLRND